MRKHSYVRWHAVIVPWPDLMDREITSQGNEIKMKKQIKCGAGQLGVCIHINTSNPRSPPPPHHACACACVCVFLWQALDACTTAPMNRDVFYFSVQCLCIKWAWRAWLPGLVGCLLWLAVPTRLSAPFVVSPALRRRRRRECHFTKAAWVELCKQ